MVSLFVCLLPIFFFKDTATTEIYTLSLHDALPICRENTNALFRRAVKLVNGNLITLPACPGAVSCGLTISTENPMYIQGDYNANSAGGGFANSSVATSVAADAVTILSVNWNDVNSFASPFNNLFNRTGATTYVRTAVVAGKQVSFKIPPWDNAGDRKSTRLNSSHGYISYAVFCLKKKKLYNVTETIAEVVCLFALSESTEPDAWHCIYADDVAIQPLRFSDTRPVYIRCAALIMFC